MPRWQLASARTIHYQHASTVGRHFSARGNWEYYVVMRTWSRVHRNGREAFVRKWPGDLFAATAWPPAGSQFNGSMPLQIVPDLDHAQRLADSFADPDCVEPDACAGEWLTS